MDGVKADMVFTDPPYNIASDSKNFASDVSKAMKNLAES
jgi:DNA modification methylase